MLSCLIDDETHVVVRFDRTVTASLGAEPNFEVEVPGPGWFPATGVTQADADSVRITHEAPDYPGQWRITGELTKITAAGGIAFPQNGSCD